MTADDLPWTVLVDCSGGWKVLAMFVDESAARSYGSTQLQARVRHEGKCLGHKDGYKAGWKACDRSGPCAGVIGELRVVPKGTVVEQMSREIGDLRKQLDRATKDSDQWLESWAQLTNDIGDLLHRARGRPKGRRFITVLELAQLLTTQAREAEGS